MVPPPHRQSHYGPEREGGSAHMAVEARETVVTAHVEKLAHADEVKLDPDRGDDEPAHQGREHQPKSRQKPREQRLEEAGEDRHAEHERKPAGLHREQRGREVDRRNDRRR